MRFKQQLNDTYRVFFIAINRYNWKEEDNLDRNCLPCLKKSSLWNAFKNWPHWKLKLINKSHWDCYYTHTHTHTHTYCPWVCYKRISGVITILSNIPLRLTALKENCHLPKFPLSSRNRFCQCHAWTRIQCRKEWSQNLVNI